MNTPMRIPMTEYLEIDLETERWRCRRCAHDLGPARGNYKEGTVVYDRDPTEIHRPLIDPGRYEFTFAPDPAWCRRGLAARFCPRCRFLAGLGRAGRAIRPLGHCGRLRLLGWRGPAGGG